jgi:hypothetical protein
VAKKTIQIKNRVVLSTQHTLKDFAKFLSFWVPLIIFESESVLWDGWIYMLLLSLVIDYFLLV